MGAVCSPGVFCVSKNPIFLAARPRAGGQAGTGSVGNSVGEGSFPGPS